MSGAVACRDVVEMVTDYLEDCLPAATRRELEAHLAVCPGCVAYLEQIRATIRLTGTVDDDALSPQAWDELRAAFRRLD